MSFLIDTIKLVGSLSNVREALVAALRAKGFPVKDDASLCEIVDTINSGAVDYCGFVRCWVGGDTIYFPDTIEISIDTRRIYHVYDAIIVSDAAKLLEQIQYFRKPKLSVIVRDYSFNRKQDKSDYDELDTLGHCTDFCAYSIVHHSSQGRVYYRNAIEPNIIVRDTVSWKVFSIVGSGDATPTSEIDELLRAGN
jgi:hypothetical protein